MRAEFQPGRRVVIVGGGYIGLEAAAVAAKLGCRCPCWKWPRAFWRAWQRRKPRPNSARCIRRMA